MSTLKKMIVVYVVCCALLAASVIAMVVSVSKSEFGQKVGKAVNAELDRKIEGK